MIAVAFLAKIPINLVGPPGIGKSEVTKTLERRMGYERVDMRLSMLETSDLGGIPVPNRETGKMEFLPYGRMPFVQFVGDRKIILVLDEFDRARLDIQGAALQLLLDGELNGHKIGPNVRIILCMNASTDVGTTPLSKAAANRMVHVNIEVGSERALAAFRKWAQETGGASARLQGFAGYRMETWANGAANPQVEDMAYATPRSFAFADRLLTILEEIEKDDAVQWPPQSGIRFETRDIKRPLLAGCVGDGAAVEFLAYTKLAHETPTEEEVIKDPRGARIPSEPSLRYVLTVQLTDYAETTKDMEHDEIVRRKKAAEAFAVYGLRWPEESAGYLFRRLAEKQPSVIATTAYHQWTAKTGRKVVVDFGTKKTTGDIV